jgi:hypothetical protein
MMKERLKKRGINIGRARTRWSTYRLYNYYVTQKHPKSDPRYLAYGMQKRTLTRIEVAEHPERIQIRTGTGRKISARAIIRKRDRMQRKLLEREMPGNITISYSHYYKTVDKLMDWVTYHVRPPLIITIPTIEKARHRLIYVADDIINIVKKIVELRKTTYRNYVVGGRIIAYTKNITTTDGEENPQINVSIAWVHIDRIENLQGSLQEGFNSLIKPLYNYGGKAMIVMTAVDLKFTTNERALNIDRLRM